MFEGLDKQVDELQPSFATFYDENYDSVCRGLSVALGDALRAEEAAQEAFTRAYVRWRRVSQMERPAGWVYVTAVRFATRRREPRSVRADRRSEDDVAEDTTRCWSSVQAVASRTIPSGRSHNFPIKPSTPGRSQQ